MLGVPLDKSATAGCTEKHLGGNNMLHHNLKMLLLLCALAAQGTLQATNLLAENWPQGRADAAGTGATAEELPKDLDIDWEYDLGGLGFEAGPVIAFGVVYAADCDGHVVALDLKTGKEIWKLSLDTEFYSSPSFEKGVIYVGDYEGNLRALDAATGKEKWIFDAGLQIDAGPNFFGDSLLVTSEEGDLYCLQKSDGKQKWKYETGDQLQCGATLAGNKTFLGGCDAHLHVIDVQTGEAIGEPLPIDAPTGSTPCALGETVFVPTYAGEIFAFAVDNPDPIWRFTNDKLSDEFKNSVAVVDGYVVAASRNKRVFALNSRTGEVRWEAALRKRAFSSPVIAGKSVFVAAGDGRVIRFDLETGKETWMMEVKAGFLGSPAVADGKLVVANDRGTIFCFGEKK